MMIERSPLRNLDGRVGVHRRVLSASLYAWDFWLVKCRECNGEIQFYFLEVRFPSWPTCQMESLTQKVSDVKDSAHSSVLCMDSTAGASLSLSGLYWTIIYNYSQQQSSDNSSKKSFLWIICRLWPEIRADTFRYMICFLAAVLFQSILVTICDEKLLHH